MANVELIGMATRRVTAKLERAGDEQINQDGDAKRQNEKREFFDFHRVFASAGFSRHGE